MIEKDLLEQIENEVNNLKHYDEIKNDVEKNNAKESFFKVVKGLLGHLKKIFIVFVFALVIWILFVLVFFILNRNDEKIKDFEIDEYSIKNSVIEKYNTYTYNILDENLFDGGELYFLKDVENRQQLSLIIKSKTGKVIVFDGGWSENAKRLTDLIKELGGTVHYWFLTHCDPDHVGALYEISGNKDLMDIKIEKIVYSFFKKELYSVLGVADAWFYESVIDRILNISEKNHVVVFDDLSIDQVIKIDDISVRIISDTRHIYKLDNYFDNNSSCCYKVTINGKNIIVLGDIAKDASNYLLRLNTKEVLKADIVVLAHHGQDGGTKELYEAIHPDICLWGTPDWLFDNKGKQWKTDDTKEWMKEMQIEKHIISKDGDWILR